MLWCLLALLRYETEKNKMFTLNTGISKLVCIRNTRTLTLIGCDPAITAHGSLNLKQEIQI
jgi:hypothetical protein